MSRRGRVGLLAGLESLAQSANNISERNRRRLADALAQEEMRQRGEYLKLAQGDRERSLAEKLALSNKAEADADAERLAAVKLEIPTARVAKQLRLGNENKAKAIALKRGLLAPSASLLSVSPVKPDDYISPKDQAYLDLARSREARAAAAAERAAKGESAVSLAEKLNEKMNAASEIQPRFKQSLLADYLGGEIGDIPDAVAADIERLSRRQAERAAGVIEPRADKEPEMTPLESAMETLADFAGIEDENANMNLTPEGREWVKKWAYGDKFIRQALIEDARGDYQKFFLTPLPGP